MAEKILVSGLEKVRADSGKSGHSHPPEVELFESLSTISRQTLTQPPAAEPCFWTEFEVTKLESVRTSFSMATGCNSSHEISNLTVFLDLNSGQNVCCTAPRLM